MRLSFIEAPDGLMAGTAEWEALSASVRGAHPDILVTNEMPFGRWRPASSSHDIQSANDWITEHSNGGMALRGLDIPFVFSSRPVALKERLANEAFCLVGADDRIVHHKHYFPAEAGFYEASWFQTGKPGFDIIRLGEIAVGFLLCTELFFNEWARHYRHLGANLIVVPRASGTSIERWRTAAAMAAIVSGCYVVSSNRVGQGPSGQVFGGRGFAFAPDGTLIDETSIGRPVITIDIDLRASAAQQRLYPCYVQENAKAGTVSAGRM